MRPLAILAVLAAAAARAGAEPDVAWEHDFDKAQARALAEGKPIFIDVLTDW